MQHDKDVRRKLLTFLDREFFDPILTKTREDFHAVVDKHHFDDAHKKVTEERQRYHDGCRTAAEVKESFLTDVESRMSNRLNENLESLGLPTFWGVKEGFLKLCQTYEM
jgi:hypothetical protein